MFYWFNANKYFTSLSSACQTNINDNNKPNCYEIAFGHNL